MKHLPLPSLDVLQQRLLYNPLTGILIWKINVGGKARAGTIAGKLDHKGYRQIQVVGIRYMEHRVAYKMATGKDPGELQIDHIDGVHDNNRSNNLRVATHSQNQMNETVFKNNESRIKGVGFHNGGWRARICKDGKSIYLGKFSSPEKAQDAIQASRESLHGSFTNHG